MLNRLATLVAVFLAVSVDLQLTSARASVVTSIWVAGADSWSNAGNWSTSAVPNNNSANEFRVLIDDGNESISSRVALDMDATISGLVIDPSDVLSVENYHRLTIISGGSFTNDGEIALRSTTTSASLVVSGGPVLLGGTGRLTLQSSGDRIQGSDDGSSSLINGPQHRIEGAGQLGLDSMGVVNQGLIDANLPNGTLSIDPNASGFVNSGLLQASNGGSLAITAGEYSNVGGRIVAEADSTVYLSIATVKGGIMEIRPQGRSTVLSSSTLEGGVNFHNEKGGTLTVENYGRLSLDANGTYLNDGEIALRSTTTSASLVVSGGPVLLGGTGRLTLQSSGDRIQGSDDGSSSLINGPQHRIEGAGQLGLDSMGVVNQGLIDANLPNGTLSIDPNASGFVNSGAVEIRPTSSLAMAFGDTYRQSIGITRVDGALVVNDGAQVEGGIVTGSGTIIGDVENAGAIAPGSTTGTLTIAGRYTQNSGGALQIELAGDAVATDFDRLTVSESVTLSGLLEVTFVNEFQPKYGVPLTILSHTSRTGEFSTTLLPQIKEPLPLRLFYGQLRETLAVVLDGDTDFDGDVDLTDLNNVRNHFGEFSLAVPGDTNFDDVVDLADLNNVRNHFGQSMPASAGVPEPTGLALGVISGLVVLSVGQTLRRLRYSSYSIDQQVFWRLEEDALFEGQDD